MKPPKRKLLCESSVLFLMVLFLQVCCESCSNTVTAERRQDVETLTRICLRSTNDIHTTQELFELVERQHIKLHAPIPKVTSQPCYRLVEPYFAHTSGRDNVVFPNRLLIEETNVTDQVRRYMSTYDGSVFMRRLE